MQTSQQAAVRRFPVSPPPVLAALQNSIVRIFGKDEVSRLSVSPAPPHPMRIQAMARLAISGDASGLEAAFAELLSQGFRAEHICQLHLTDTARLLGEMWVQDECSFVDVTLGTILLGNELRRLAPRLARGAAEGRGRSALMLRAPGEHHGLGLSMLAEFFRAAGWYVDECEADEAEQRVREAEFGLIALTVGTQERALALPGYIARLRLASRHRQAVVMVGGAALNAEPSLLPILGADASAPDAATALTRAEALVSLMAAGG